MTEMDEDRRRVLEHYKHFFHPFHGHRHLPHTPSPVTGGEAYQRLLWHKQHVLFELKVSVMVLLGVVVIVACVVYIVLQCRSRHRPPGPHRDQKDDEKQLFGSTETLENLIPAENSIRLKVRKDKECFV